MKIISIGTDRNIFKPDSQVRARAMEYASLFDELHVIVFAKRNFKFQMTNVKTNGINLFLYPTNSISKLFYIFDAYKIAKRIIKENQLTKENSIITVQDPFETGLVGAKIKKHFGLRLHVQVHTDIFSLYFSKLSILNKIRVNIARKTLPKADAIRTVSERVKKSIKKEVSGTRSPSVLPIFVDINKYQHTTITTDLKKKYPQFDFILLVASRLTQEKNIELSLRLTERLVKSYPKMGLVIVGDGPEKEKLELLTKNYGLISNVIFEPWSNDLVSYYKTADIFLVTSWFEGYSMAIIEAIASGCPVVSTDVGIAPEILQNICPVGDVECLEKTILTYIKNKDFRDQVTSQAFNRLNQVAIIDKKEYLNRYKEDILSALK